MQAGLTPILRKTLLFVMLVAMSSPEASRQSWTPFDVPQGKFEILLQQATDENGSLQCIVREGSSKQADSNWSGVVSINVGDSDEKKRAQIRYKPENDSEVFEMAEILGQRDIERTEFLLLKRVTGDAVFSISWSESGKVVFQAMDNSGQFGRTSRIYPDLLPETDLLP